MELWQLNEKMIIVYTTKDQGFHWVRWGKLYLDFIKEFKSWNIL